MKYLLCILRGHTFERDFLNPFESQPCLRCTRRFKLGYDGMNPVLIRQERRTYR